MSIPLSLKGVVIPGDRGKVVAPKGAQRFMEQALSELKSRPYGPADDKLFTELVNLPFAAMVDFLPVVRYYNLKLASHLDGIYGRTAKEVAGDRVRSATEFLDIVKKEEPKPAPWHRLKAFVTGQRAEDVMRSWQAWQSYRDKVARDLQRAEAYYRTVPGGGGSDSVQIPYGSFPRAFAAAVRTLVNFTLSHRIIPRPGEAGYIIFTIYGTAEGGLSEALTLAKAQSLAAAGVNW